MLAITGYEIREKLYEGAHTLIFRGLSTQDRKPVIIKILKDEYPTLDQISRFKREYEINRTVEQLGIGKVYSLQKVGKTYAIIFEDSGARSLDQVLASTKLSLKECLEIANQIAAQLDKIHQKPIIHKDINPSNIIWNAQSKQAQLIDFGISSTLPREKLGIVNPNQLEGTLVYISPEQTGRVNRGIDERTDYYSLGITLYQMLTGDVPFKSQDPMELIHLQIAKAPPPPSTVNQEIPETLSNIVMKLISKTPEDRYQGARGLEYDLNQCLDSLQKSGKIPPFPLGSHDISDRFEISGKMYGRKEELGLLLKSFEAASLGQARLMLVSGFSGIGKTSLIREVHKPLVEKRGIFISGKCEQFKEDIPYGGIIQALEDFVRNILQESSQVKNMWKRTLLAAVGSNGGLVTNLIPSFEEILGPQTTPPELGPIEAQDRFNLVFVKFLQALSSREHPLVMFVDDLQWANLTTLSLIKSVLMNPDSKYILFIGAYRDNEPKSESIGRFASNELSKVGIIPDMIKLGPLPFPDLWEMTTDTLQTLPDKAKPLAELCYSRSNGNPFFFIQLLKYLHQKRLIHLDQNREHWEWDLEQIQKEGITENIADLMAYKIEKLPAPTQEVLKISAAIGFQFDLFTLAKIYNKTPEETLKDLWEALQEELIFPEDDSYKYVIHQEGLSQNNPRFRFVHDRIQHAAYEKIEKSILAALHYQIGNYLLNSTPKDKLEENVFLITDHLLLGESFAAGEEGRHLLIRLNLLAGKKAKSNTAFTTASEYLQYAKKKLKPDSWETEYGLSLDISKTLAECLYNSSQIEEGYSLVREILQKVKTDFERAEIFTMQGYQLIAIGQIKEALDCGLEGLKLFNIKMPKHPSKALLLKELAFARWNLGFRSINSLINEPLMTSQRHIQIIKLMNMIRTPAFYLGNSELVALIALKSANISLRNGNCEESALAYELLGMILHSFFYRLEVGSEFMKLGIAMNEKYNDIHNRANIHAVYTLFCLAFEKHWKTLQGKFNEAIEISLRLGQMIWTAAMAAQAYIWDPEASREIIYEESKKYEKMIDKTRFLIPWDTFKIGQAFQANLAGKTTDRFSMSLPNLDEFKAVEELKKVNFRTALAAYYNRKSVINYLYGKPKEALELSELAAKEVPSIYGSPSYTDYCLYAFLVYAANIKDFSFLKRISIYSKMKKLLTNMRRWAKYCPVNFEHKNLLMEAELARVKGKKKKAIKLYERAIASAKRDEFLVVEALATELAAKFYLDSKQYAVARTLMREAYYAWYKFGAVTKLKVMAEMYPDIISEEPISGGTMTLTATTTTHGTTTTTTSFRSSLDIHTVMKSAQTISSEIVMEKLIKKMMHIIIESAGAEKGWLILEKEGVWIVEAEATIDDARLISQPIDSIAKSLINSVIYSKTPISFSNPAWLGQFASDPYIQRVHPKAVLCMPLINHGELRGIIYLENNLTKDAFTNDRLEVLNLLGSQVASALDNARLYNDLLVANKDLKRLNESLSRFIPNEFFAILGKDHIWDVKIGDSVQKEMTVLFTDIRNFTSRSEKMSPQENFQFVNQFLSVIAPVIRGNKGFIDKYLGDGFMALFPTEADAALQAAIQMLRSLNDYNAKYFSKPEEMIKIGIGLHTGLVMLGTVGEEQRLEETVISDVVNTASRLEEETKDYVIPLLISEETFSKLKRPEHYDLRQIDRISVRGKTTLLTIYEVFESEHPDVVVLKRKTRPDFEKAVALFHENKLEQALPLFETIAKENPADLPAIRWCNRIKKGKN